mmetsp:Transcript_82313/g.172400  ORF Transcript_82313/g.172400 Transcript_82313/m.172400 type:complete len:490 (+) Transcript_82313:17-1486(+)
MLQGKEHVEGEFETPQNAESLQQGEDLSSRATSADEESINDNESFEASIDDVQLKSSLDSISVGSPKDNFDIHWKQWLLQPAVFFAVCWMIGCTIAACFFGTPSHHSEWYLRLNEAAWIPYFLSSTWIYSVTAEVPLLVSFMVGFLVNISALVFWHLDSGAERLMALSLAAWLGMSSLVCGRRRIIGLSVLAWTQFLLFWTCSLVRWTNCNDGSVHSLQIVAMQVILRISEALFRSSISRLWKNFAGGAPGSLLTVLVVWTALNAELQQFSSFLMAATSGDKWIFHLSLLAILATLGDILSRSRLLRIFWNRCWAHKNYKASLAVDISLRARLSGPYIVLGPAICCVLLLLVCMGYSAGPHAVAVAAYFISESVADVATILWQRWVLLRYHSMSRTFFGTIRTLHEQQGHAFPTFLPTDDTTPSSQPREATSRNHLVESKAEEKLSRFLCIPPEAMFGIALVSFSGVLLRECALPLFFQKSELACFAVH